MADDPQLPDGWVRPGPAGVRPYVPGRPVEEVRRERGLERVVKLASNEGPFPPAPEAVAALEACSADQRLYPDPGCWEVRDLLAGRLGVTAAQITVGAGIDGLIKYLGILSLGPGDALAMSWPSFVQWRAVAGIQGARVDAAPLAADGSCDLDRLLAEIRPETKMVVVVSPNNPTGAAVEPGALDAFLDAVPDHVLPVVDEAYFEFLPAGGHDAAALVASGRRLAVLRTFSKAYALAGLRIGYLVGPEQLSQELARVRNAFDVTGPAQAAAAASLRAPEAGLTERLDVIRAERDRVRAGLEGAGMTPLPSDANFLFVPFADEGAAADVIERLMAAGVIVRGTGPFGAPEGVRITIGLPEENDRMLAALAASTG